MKTLIMLDKRDKREVNKRRTDEVLFALRETFHSAVNGGWRFCTALVGSSSRGMQKCKTRVRAFH